MAEMEGIGRNPDGTYDVAKANKAWEGKWMDDAKFQAARAKLVGELGTKARGELDQIKNICDDNDGTNRPNAKVGYGTTEAALRAEAETGKPVGDVGGHAEKATDAVRTLQALVTARAAGSRTSAPTPHWSPRSTPRSHARSSGSPRCAAGSMCGTIAPRCSPRSGTPTARCATRSARCRRCRLRSPIRITSTEVRRDRGVARTR